MSRRAFTVFLALSALQLALSIAYGHAIGMRNAAREAVAGLKAEVAGSAGAIVRTAVVGVQSRSEALVQRQARLEQASHVLAVRNTVLRTLRWLDLSLLAAVIVAGAWTLSALTQRTEPAPLP